MILHYDMWMVEVQVTQQLNVLLPVFYLSITVVTSTPFWPQENLIHKQLM